MRAEVRRVDQHIEGFAAGRRDAGLSPSRGADVAGWIGSRLAPPVDRLELLLRVAGEDEVVVQQMVVTPVQPEVEHDAGTGRFVAAAALEARWPPRRRAAPGASARHRHWRPPHRAGCCSPASVSTPRTPPSPRLQNAPHSRSGPDLDTQLGRKSGQCPRHGPRASQRIPDSLAGLHVGDAAEYRGRRVRSRAHVLGEMIEHLGDARVGHVRAHRRGHRTALGARREGRATDDGSKAVLTLNVSRRPPTGRQKKKRSETRCNRAECSMKRR